MGYIIIIYSGITMIILSMGYNNMITTIIWLGFVIPMDPLCTFCERLAYDLGG